MKNKNILITTALSAFIAACAPKAAYYDRGQPESLITKSSEVVDFKIESPASMDKISSWIARDKPTRAVLKCPESDGLCTETQSMLHQFNIPVKYIASPQNTLALVYERIQARNCENRYIDNYNDWLNLNHPTFGCSVAANMVQMVSDKREFTDPAIMEYPDASKTAQTMSLYQAPPKTVTDFSTLNQSGGSSGR